MRAWRDWEPFPLHPALCRIAFGSFIIIIWASLLSRSSFILSGAKIYGKFKFYHYSIFFSNMLYLDRNVSTGKQPGSLLLRGVLEISVRKLRISCCWFWQSFWFWAWDYRGPKGRCPIDRLKSLFGKRLPKGLRVSVLFQKWVPPLNSLDPLRPAAVLLNEPVPENYNGFKRISWDKFVCVILRNNFEPDLVLTI